MTKNTKIALVIATIVAVILALVLIPQTTADANEGNGQEKVGVCHRTASDSNPYVFIEVPADEANGHITGTDKQHNSKAVWKSDGTFRGVPHKAGDVKLDYYATSATECQDTEVPPADEPVTPAVTAVDNCGVLTDSVTGVVSEGYTSVTTNAGLVYTTVFTAEPGFVLTSAEPIITTLTDVACPTETPSTPPVTPETPTETPTVPTETPVTPETPEDDSPEAPENEGPDDNGNDGPKSTPQPPKHNTPAPPKDVQVIACVDGVWTTQVNGQTISESGSCVEDSENTTFQTFNETGL